MRVPVIAGNWKMNKTAGEAVFLVQELEERVRYVENVEIIICPPFTALRSLEVVFDQDKPNMWLGAQDMHWEDAGAYTGEVSPAMLTDLGVTHVIIGHSERRQLFGETNETVNKKVLSAFAHKLTAIMCCGETLGQREAGKTEAIVGDQVKRGLDGLSEEQTSRLIIAYEPIWAIGTGRTATPEMANETVGFVRQTVRGIAGDAAADATRVLYGGSVKPENIDELMATSDIDGALVGGACLEAESFARIISFKRET